MKTHHIATFPPGIVVLGMTVYRGKVIVATNKGVYYLDDADKLRLILLEAGRGN